MIELYGISVIGFLSMTFVLLGVRGVMDFMSHINDPVEPYQPFITPREGIK